MAEGSDRLRPFSVMPIASGPHGGGREKVQGEGGGMVGNARDYETQRAPTPKPPTSRDPIQGKGVKFAISEKSEHSPCAFLYLNPQSTRE